MARRVFLGWILAILLGGAAVGAAELGSPEPVSPGSRQQVETVGQSCPTFSWGEVAGSAGYRLVVYELTAEGELSRPVIRQRLVAGASSWSPPLRQGLEPGGSYAWTVGAVTRRGKTLWSEPALFRVASGPSRSEFEEAMAVVRGYLAVQGEPEGRIARTPQGARDRTGSRVEEPAGAFWAPEATTTQLSVDGGVVATSFTGDGSTLTSLDPSSLANVVPVAKGGTGATTTAAACANLGAATAASLVAHAAGSDHDTRYYTKVEFQSDGSAAVHWGNLTALPTTEKGDLLVETGEEVVRLAVGSDGQTLTADSTQPTGLRWADSGAPVPRTGQTFSYAAGDDGDLEMGVSWPNPRFTNNGDHTVTDNLTGLVWLRDGNCISSYYPGFDRDSTLGDGRVTWQHALDFVAAINRGSYDMCNRWGGRKFDWRLPNILEIASLFSYAEYPDGGFPSATTNVHGPYWSSTTWPNNPDEAFVFGGVSSWNGKNTDYYVWPVRGGE